MSDKCRPSTAVRVFRPNDRSAAVAAIQGRASDVGSRPKEARKRLGNAEDYAQLALTMITNGYFNGEDVRIDGAIRMAPR